MTEEAAILAGARENSRSARWVEVVERYRSEVTDKKTGSTDAGLTTRRFDAWLPTIPSWQNKVFHQVTGNDLAAWRCRLRHVQRGRACCVRRSNTGPSGLWLSKQWKWAGSSPWKEITLPAASYARRRVSRWMEVRRISLCWRIAALGPADGYARNRLGDDDCACIPPRAAAKF